MTSIMQYPQWQFTNGDTLPVGTIYGIGRNYADHAAEMGAEVPTAPIIFIKPPTAYLPNGSTVALPPWSNDVHFEVELVVVIGMNANEITQEEAHTLIAGVGVGIDLTARDIQQKAKANGEPWAIAKGWKGSAPVGDIVSYAGDGLDVWQLSLSINHQLRQQALTSSMQRTIPELIATVCNIFGLKKGDCIFTGTPAGVGKVSSGDVAIATLSNLTSLTVQFA